MNPYDEKTLKWSAFHSYLIGQFGPLFEKDVVAAYLAHHALGEQHRRIYGPTHGKEGQLNVSLKNLIDLKEKKMSDEAYDAYLKQSGAYQSPAHLHFVEKVKRGSPHDFETKRPISPHRVRLPSRTKVKKPQRPSRRKPGPLH